MGNLPAATRAAADVDTLGPGKPIVVSAGVGKAQNNNM
jgi:hypothetical protein